MRVKYVERMGTDTCRWCTIQIVNTASTTWTVFTSAHNYTRGHATRNPSDNMRHPSRGSEIPTTIWHYQDRDWYWDTNTLSTVAIYRLMESEVVEGGEDSLSVCQSVWLSVSPYECQKWLSIKIYVNMLPAGPKCRERYWSRHKRTTAWYTHEPNIQVRNGWQGVGWYTHSTNLMYPLNTKLERKRQ